MSVVRDLAFNMCVMLGSYFAMTAPFDLAGLTGSQTLVLCVGNLAVFWIAVRALERFHEWLNQKMRASDHQL